METNWARLIKGVSTAAPDPRLHDVPVQFSCRVPDFDADKLLGSRLSWQLDPVSQFALIAAREAIADAGHDVEGWDAPRVGVVIGSCVGGAQTSAVQNDKFHDSGPDAVSAMFLPMSLVNMVAGVLSIHCNATGPNLLVSTACASGSTAIGVACELLLRDQCDIVIAGGAEAAITPLYVSGFARMGTLSRRNDDPTGASRPFSAERDGFVMAEGAGILVLERVEDAEARRAPVWARVLGYGNSADGYHVTSPHPEALGARAAAEQACTQAGISPSEVQHVNAHGSGTKLSDAVESRYIADYFPKAITTSTKSLIGHPLGAAGAIEAAYTAMSLRHQLIPATANLDPQDPAIEIDIAAETRPAAIDLAMSNSFGFGGHNAVLLMGR
ncbi:beta-ketoacyl-[acyl-carrier-protein] synthase family protein (plasmid) [Streptomyces sp. FXJ1.172]|uniref:beta-ketoacyl-[acyl-carrier-protein] synthase family protein n=1 Tax=Streptomyces sp. FXJ1.172 TaxID=710705 RepID=UPI0023DD4563|nr:beta-ketoacyl-[acyl-carrier-protein] synthase family protein [Streptomyces sp. FXJ1.172]WEP00550.1 beta-ketoacyl-[acyl-carrier-protein] synthase family protein [Streptomyces sp. FXJ1.172]